MNNDFLLPSWSIAPLRQRLRERVVARAVGGIDALGEAVRLLGVEVDLWVESAKEFCAAMAALRFTSPDWPRLALRLTDSQFFPRAARSGPRCPRRNRARSRPGFKWAAMAVAR